MNPSRWGPLASGITGLCCLGAAPVIAAVSAVGLGFLIRDAILIPLLALFLGLTIWGLRREHSRHGRAGPERLSWLAAALTLAGLWMSALVAGLGLALLVAASLWSLLLTRRRPTGSRARA